MLRGLKEMQKDAARLYDSIGDEWPEDTSAKEIEKMESVFLAHVAEARSILMR